MMFPSKIHYHLVCVVPALFSLFCSSVKGQSSSDDARPVEHLCPISFQIMQDPFVAGDGHTYERDSIETWLKTKNTSPLTGQVIPKTTTPNFALKKLITEWKRGVKPVVCDFEFLSSQDVQQRINEEFQKNLGILHSSKNKHIVACFGNTGAGKSTLINLIAGNALRVENREYVLDHPDDVNAMEIGTGADSKTLYPKCLSIDDVLYYDFPGFNDTEGSIRNLINAAFIKKILMEALSVRFIFVVGEDQFTADRGASVKKLFESIGDLFVTKDSTLDIVQNSLFVVTKSNETEVNKELQFLSAKCHSQFQEDVKNRLAQWCALNRFLHFCSPHMFREDEERDRHNQLTRTHIVETVKSLQPIKVSALNVSVFYPTETMHHLIRLFLDVFEKQFNQFIQTPLMTLSEIEERYSLITDGKNGFWGIIHLALSKDDSFLLLKDFCETPYQEAKRQFVASKSKEVDIYKTAVENRKKQRIDAIHDETKLQITKAIDTLVRKRNGVPVKIDSGYYQRIEDHFFDPKHLNSLSTDEREQKVIREQFHQFMDEYTEQQEREIVANFFSNSSGKDINESHELFLVRRRRAEEKIAELQEEIQRLKKDIQPLKGMSSALKEGETYVLLPLAENASLMAVIKKASYELFLRGKLTWTDPLNSKNTLEFRIRDLPDPLFSRFDFPIDLINAFGGRYSLCTGYNRNRGNLGEDNLYVWIIPDFLANFTALGGLPHYSGFIHEDVYCILFYIKSMQGSYCWNVKRSFKSEPLIMPVDIKNNAECIVKNIYPTDDKEAEKRCTLQMENDLRFFTNFKLSWED